MPRNSSILIALGMLALLVAPALAEQAEVVHFTNGTTMTVYSHAIEEDQVVVSLDGNSYMAFPLNQIDKIETASGAVAIARDGIANRMVPTSGQGVVPSRNIRGAWEGEINKNEEQDPSIGVDDKGVAIFRPFPNGPSNKRQFGVSGRRELRNVAPSRSGQNGHIGATQVGTRYVLPSKQKGVPKQMPVGLAQGAPPKKKNDND